MEVQTPLGWLRDMAAHDPDRVCLVLADGDVSYADMWRLIGARTSLIRGEVQPRSVIPVPVRSDLSSVVELLAVSLAGAVPLPYGEVRPIVDERATSDDAILVQTSGSTGGPSVVRISASNIEAAVKASRLALQTTEADRWLACLPLSHVGGLAALWRTFESGGSVVLAPFDGALPHLIRRAKPTVASFVPTMVRRLLDEDPSLLADLRLVLVGGASTSRSLLEDAARHAVSLASTYGMTETTSQVATAPVLSADDEPQWPPRGIPLPGFEITIVAETGEEAEPGTVGRILVDGPAVSAGYLGRPDRTGPFETNDMGFLDPRGWLCVVGRSDDVIVSGGENVSLPAVAETIRQFPGVDDVVAIGIPDAEWGVVVGVMVAGDVARDALRVEAAARLAPHDRPKHWIVVDSIPVLESGKPDLIAIGRALDGG
jgi:O-succinylbenzoic acid--CoA ligase